MNSPKPDISPNTPPDITIAIASMGRPCLLRTLNSLAAMALPPNCRIEIVIADDDPGGAAAALLASQEFAVQISIVPVGSRNISVARNACLDAAEAELIAFVDDDEWVAEDWLLRMLAAMEEFEADCVFGPVFPQYPPGTPDWLREANPLHNDWGHRGKRVLIGRTGNTLLRRRLVDLHHLRFDPALGRSGGEDTEFFHQMSTHGARMFVTDDAHVFEEVPPERLEPGYLRQRYIRAGQSYARFHLRHAGNSAGGTRGAGRIGFALSSATKTALGLGLGTLLRGLAPARALRFSIRGWMNLGKLRELRQLPLPEPYAPAAVQGNGTSNKERPNRARQ